jgi:hypothetical protein
VLYTYEFILVLYWNVLFHFAHIERHENIMKWTANANYISEFIPEITSSTMKCNRSLISRGRCFSFLFQNSSVSLLSVEFLIVMRSTKLLVVTCAKKHS